MPIANAAYLKYPYQRIKSWAFNVFPKQVVATAKINATYTTGDYPRADLTVDTTSAGWGDVLEDMFVEISRGGVAFYRGSIRRVPDVDVLYIAGLAYGDTGQTREDAQAFADNDDIAIYSVRIPWVFWSIIDLETKFAYKKWDLEVWYEDDPTISRNAYPQPVANLGSWQRGEVDSGTGVATLTHSAAASTVWRGSGFTVEWILPTGAALASGYSLTDETIEVEYDAGIYIIGCTVTEVGGATPARTRTGWRYVWAIDNDTVFDTSNLIDIQIGSDTHIYNEGRVLTATLTGTAATLRDILYTGAPILMNVQYAYSDDGWASEVMLASEDSIGAYSGYITAYDAIRNTGDIQSVQVQIENVMSVCRRLGVAKQILTVKANPNRWHKIVSQLGNVSFFIYYLMDYHASWILNLHDYDHATLDAFENISFKSSGQDLLSAMQNATAYVLGATIGATSDGAIVLKRAPQIESDAYNAALDERMTIDADHLIGELNYQRNEIATQFDVRGGFIVSTTTRPVDAYIGRTNAGAPAQGTSLGTMPNNIALSLPDGLARTGHYRQMINAPTPEISLNWVALQDVIDPCRQGLYELGLGDYDPMQTGLADNRLFTARRVDRSWSLASNSEPQLALTTVFAPLTRGVTALTESQPGISTDGDSDIYAVEVRDLSFFNAITAGTYNGGTGFWETTDITLPNGRKRRLIDIQQDEVSPYDMVANISITFDLTIGTVVNDDAYCFQLIHTRTNGTEQILSSVSFAQAAGVYEGTAVEYIWTGRVVLKGLRIRLSSCLVNNAGTQDGTALLRGLSYLLVVG